ncbi:hypothetical protein O0I10_001548 [Lichtheimia ornata]|uniref:PCI domain-containing protein n=1 Tax=Lichtheimia ornata TaxID=688661 RepID=A0AAD7Y2V4_9FUNG|nr:uncharacterized protein O0I10_001548 [Lichtheimia ornata]KAJ8662587.1 hypothetical protein O0I10_001548 [Lichtheimia ornata]
MRSLQLYLDKVRHAVDSENGKQLAALYSINQQHVRSLTDQNLQIDRIDTTCRYKMMSPWDEMTACHIKTIVHLDRRHYGLAFETQKELVQLFQRAMPNLTRWCLPVLYTINNDLRVIATQADTETAAAMSDQETSQRKKLEEAANVISKSFTYCVTDRNSISQSKKFGTYCMIGILFRIYFKLKQQNLCKNILRAVKVAGMPDIDEFPKADRVTFRYYLGRLYFLEEEYGKAEHELELAFRECTNANQKNKEVILKFLLPIRLMRGKMPSRLLFERYPKSRHLYSHLVQSIKAGNIRSFDMRLDKVGPTLIRQGTYFAVEKARSLAIRQLFRKVYLIMDKSTRIPISTFKTALEAVNIDVDLEETEWMLANMIFKGYMKGYLSHEKLFAVLSKADPFPKVSTIAAHQ